jgi:hypothetical protein
MHRFLLLAALLLAGCGVVTPQATLDPTIAAMPSSLQFRPDSTTLPSESLGPYVSMYSESGSLRVTLASEPEVETSTQPFFLQGTAPAGTVLTVNEQILVVDETGTFQVDVPLEDGPNLVEVVASNAAGDEVEFLLTIYYNP